MRTDKSLIVVASLLFICLVLFGCGGGGSAHGITDQTKSVIVHGGSPSLLVQLPDGTEGGADALRASATRIKVEHHDSVGFVDDLSGFTWVVYAIPVTSRSASTTHRMLIKIPKHPISTTRGAGSPYNVLLSLESGEEILITDSATDPANLIAVGFQNSSTIVDSAATEIDLTGVIYSLLPNNIPIPHYVSQTAAIIALDGWNR